MTTSSHNKKIPLLIIAIIVVGGIVGGLIISGVWQPFGLKVKEPEVPSLFNLEAIKQDAAGINPKTKFVLESTEPLTAQAVKKILKFSPQVDFEVKKAESASNILSSVFAQSANSQDSKISYEIIPTKPLTGDKVYQATIAKSAFANREYSWAFQAKTPFQVIKTHPRNEGTSVPINSGIEVTFNREKFKNPQNYFQIEPSVPGTFEQHGDTLIFLPKKLEAKTVYTVTVKKGLGIENSDDKLKEDHVFKFETGSKRYATSKPSFNFRHDLFNFLPGKKPVTAVDYYKLDPKDLEIDVYKLSDAGEFLTSYRESKNWELSWTRYHQQRAEGYTADSDKKILSFSPEIISSGYSKYVEIPQALEEGYYLLDVQVGERHSQSWLQVSPVSHYFSVTHGNGLIWLYDYQKNQPLTQAEVSFYDENKDESYLGEADKEGLVEFETPPGLQEKGEDSTYPQFFKVKTEGHLPAVIEVSDRWGYRARASKGDSYWDYLSTDRYTYRLNDTVRFWGVVKGRENDLRQKKVKVSLYSGWYYYWRGSYSRPTGEALVSEEVLVSQFDTIQGQLSYKGLSPGSYNVVVEYNDQVISSTGIQVFSYAKPAYQIDVQASKDAIFAGQSVKFHVKANFFDGTPVSDLVLKYRGYWDGSVEGELKLDKNGEGVLTYTPRYYDSLDYARSFELSFSPKLGEEGEMWGRDRVLVFGPHIYLQSFREDKGDNTYKFTAKLNQVVIDQKEESSDQHLRRNEYIGDPVSGHAVKARIVKITYNKVETGQYYDPINKVVRKKYDYHRNERTIDTLKGVTNGKGEWSFEKHFSEEEGARYNIIFSTEDSGGRKTDASSYVYPSFSYSSSWKDFSASLKINSESYSSEFSVGDEVELQLNLEGEKKPKRAKVLFYRYQSDIQKISIESDYDFEEMFRRQFVPSVQYRAIILSPYGFEESNAVTASFKEEDKNLSIDLRPLKEKYRPGEQVNVDIKVTDQQGMSESAEVNVAVVDEALFHILPYNWQPKILSTLYQNIYVTPITGASEYVLFEKEGAEMGGCFGKGTPILMRDHSQQPIEKVRVGDVILTRKNKESEKLVPAVVQGVSKHYVDGYLEINDSLTVTPEHRIYVNGDWDYAANIKKGDQLITADGSLSTVHSIEKIAKKNFPVYNIVVGDYHTYFAGDLFVHNAEKGGKARTDFVDVALYKTVHANSRGRATVQFEAPDNITSWRITARAFSSDNMKAGQEEKLISTSLPLFVNATLNKTYLAADEPTLRLRAFGDEYQHRKTTQFAVKSGSLNIDKEESSLDNTAYIPLGKFSEGEHEVKISVKQGSLQDAVVRDVDVVKSYFKKSESFFYSLSENLSQIKGNKDGFTKLVFVDKGKGKLYRTLRSNTYARGLRVDQTVAEYYSKKLLSTYFDEALPEEQLDLSNYHTQKGGISLFPYSDNALALSARIADLAPKFIFKGRVKDYFKQSLKDKKSDIHRISKALYGLASLGEPVLVKINSVNKSEALTLEDKIYLGLAYAKLGAKESARILYQQDIRNNLRFQGHESWLASEQDKTVRVKLTGLIAVLSSYLHEDSDADALWKYISSHSPVRDLDLLEETLFAKSELNKLADRKKTPSFHYQTNKRSRDVALKKGRTFSLKLPPGELNSLRFSSIKGEISVVSHYERSRDPEELETNSELSLSRQYLVNNQPVHSLQEGDVVVVRLDPRIANTAIDGSYQVVDYLPSGLKPITRRYEQGLSGRNFGICNPFWYPAKVVGNTVYFHIYKGFNKTSHCRNRTINYYARVVSKGNYRANSALIQSLKAVDSLNLSSKDKIIIR